MAILSILLTVIIVTVSILLVLVVLIQRPKQEGLGAAFGGGAFDSALGAHTTDILQKITSWLGVIFFVCAIALSMITAHQNKRSGANDLLEGVKDKAAELPAGLPADLSNIPGLEGMTTTPAAEKPAPAAETKPAAKKPAPVAETKPAAKKPAPVAETKPAAEKPAPAAETKPAAEKPAPAAETKPAAEKPAPAAETKPAPAEGGANPKG